MHVTRSSAVKALARAIKKREKKKYLLKLYVAGITPRSEGAVTSITNICKEHLRNRYRLDVIDIYQQPELAKEAQIVAAPTLIKLLPAPPRRFIGSMVDAERILLGLDLKGKEEAIA